MEITRETLQRRYADLVDAELLRRVRSGVLTELANEVALAELTSRGLSPDSEIAPETPAVLAEIDFEPDEFERNPYQAPRVSAHDAASQAPRTVRFGLWDVLWFIYAAIFALLAATATAFAANPQDPETLIELAVSGFALAGIVGWRRRRRWLNPVAWVACLAINLAWLTVMLREAWVALRADASSDLVPFFIAGVTVMTVLHLPLLWGVARYAFFSPSIWRRHEPAPGTE